MDILDHYPYFESNQVLTHTQLNELFKYLDDQNRLTRCKLIGTGIVCGLDVTAPATNGEETVPIKISAGLGVTSEGYLAALDGALPKYYRAYTLPEGEPYAPFEYTDTSSTPSETKQYELFELVDEAGYVESTDSEIDAGFLGDKVIIVFLEMYNYDPRSCLVRSCDEIGQTTYIKTRILATTTDIAEKIRENTDLVPDGKDIFEERFGLETVALERVLFAPDDFNGPTDSLRVIYEKFRDAVLDVHSGLSKAIQTTYNVYKPILLPLYGQEPNELTKVTNIMKAWADYLSKENSTQDYYGMHYFYDFIKDLILAYDEFRFTAFDVVRKCNIDTDLFPRHLFLGEAYPSISDHDPQLNRNTFIQPYLYKHLTDQIEKVKSLHQRLIQMIIHFKFNFIANPDNGLTPKITPSKEKGTMLSDRSIPFYYSIADEKSNLLETWNYELYRRRLSDENLSFHASNYAAGKEFITDPLSYDYDKYPFLRIEGNNAAPAKDIFKGLEKERAGKNLPFYIRLINLNQAAGDIVVTDSNLWKDLQTEYLGVRDKFLCQIKQLISCLAIPDGGEYKTSILELIENINTIYSLIPEILPFELSGTDSGELITQMNKIYDNLIEFVLYIKHLFGKLVNEQYTVLPSGEFHERMQGLNSVYYAINNYLSGCQLYTLLTIIYRYQFRINYLQNTSTELFPNFITRHPGLEHMAGVPKGGTYIMIRDNLTVSGTETERIVADFALPYVCCSDTQQIPSPDYEAANLELPPVAIADYFLVSNEEESVPLNVMDNDIYRENYNLKIVNISENKNVGTDDDGNPLYKVPEGFTGIDRFEYTIRHVEGNSLTSSVPVKVLVRDPYQVIPKAVDDIDFTDIDTIIDIDVLGNDYYNSNTKLELVNSHSALGAVLSVVNIGGKSFIRYSPISAGRDNFRYKLVDDWRLPVVESEGEVRVFVSKTSGGSYSAPLVVQKDSTDNGLSVLLETDEGNYKLFLIDNTGAKVTSCITENGQARTEPPDGVGMILYTPNPGFYGTDKIRYYIEFENGTSRTGTVDLFVICCCIDLPGYSLKVVPNTEYGLLITQYNEIYPDIKFISLGQFDRDIVKSVLINEDQILIVPLDDIVFCRTYSFDFYATDKNNNCYKGTIEILSEELSVEIPDINVHVTSQNPILIKPEIPEKYDWKISNAYGLDKTYGELKITNLGQAINYFPAEGIQEVLVATFSYDIVDQKAEKLTARVNLINLTERYTAYTDFDLVNKFFSVKPLSNELFGCAVDIYGNYVVVGAMNAPYQDRSGSGMAYLYEKQGPIWTKMQNLYELAENIDNNKLGCSVGITRILGIGDFVFLGAYGNKSDAGAVYVIYKPEYKDEWNSYQVLRPAETISGEMFGMSLALYQSGAIIASPGKKLDSGNTGCVYIFGMKENEWSEYQMLVSPVTQKRLVFGHALDVYQATIVITSYDIKDAGVEEGSCSVFEKNQNTEKWEEIQRITPPGTDLANGFGHAVAIYDNWLAISSVTQKDEARGKVSVYKCDTKGKWNLVQIIEPSDAFEGNRFGQSISISGDLLVVGSMALNANKERPECAYVFQLEQSNWIQKQMIIKDNEPTGFGVSLALDSDKLIVGADNEVIGTVTSGSASIYEQIQPG